MNNIYIELSVAILPDEPFRERFISEVNELPILGLQETDNHILFYISKVDWTLEIENSFNNILKLFSLDKTQVLNINELKEENWNLKWEKSLTPIEIGEKFLITQTWHDIIDTNRIKLFIDPKMSFGTGYHETTRLMLRVMENLNLNNKSVLDIGTGTGILAIASQKLGASKIVGVDIDQWSISNSIENKNSNNADNCEFILGSINEVKLNEFDYVLANITRNTILELLPKIKIRMMKNSCLILSGLLNSDEDFVSSELKENSFVIKSILRENEWSAICANL